MVLAPDDGTPASLTHLSRLSRAHVVHVVSTAPVVHAVHAVDVNVGVDVNTTINSVSPSMLAMAVPRLHTTLHPPYSTRVSRNLDTRWV